MVNHLLRAREPGLIRAAERQFDPVMQALRIWLGTWGKRRAAVANLCIA